MKCPRCGGKGYSEIVNLWHSDVFDCRTCKGTGEVVATQYRKKPVVIEAFQMTEERRNDNRDWPEWLNRAWNEPTGNVGAVYVVFPEPGERVMFVNTLEGPLKISNGDWIIKGMAGELYPCKPDIFEATYEAVSA